MTADVSDAAGNAASTVTSSSFSVDTTAPTISAIATSAFTWGAVLNSTEDNSNGTVTVTTSGAEDGQTVTITLNSATCLLYTSPSPRDRQKSRMPSSA